MRTWSWLRIVVCLRVLTSRRIVKLCLRYGVDANAQNHLGDTVIAAMCRKRTYPKQLELIEYMAFHGTDIETKNYVGQTALAVAASMGRTDILEKLVSLEADVRVVP